MARFRIRSAILVVSGKVRWFGFLVKYHLPLSLKRESAAWALEVQDFEAIVGVIRAYRAGDSVCVVELGSGISTLVLALIMPRMFKDVHIFSIEAEKSVALHIQDLIQKHKLNNVVSLHHVPYEACNNGRWFSKEALRRVLKERKVDIALVDAPPGTLCRRARQHAIPFFLPYLEEDAIVLLHDVYRQDESFIAEEWRHYFRSRRDIDTPRGIAVFEGLQ